jgi:hypothetical protein
MRKNTSEITRLIHDNFWIVLSFAFGQPAVGKYIDYFKQAGHPPLGSVEQADGSTTELHFRDMINKLMHGTEYKWQLGGDDPKIIVLSDQPERWRSAEISVQALMALIGGLMF